MAVLYDHLACHFIVEEGEWGQKIIGFPSISVSKDSNVFFSGCPCYSEDKKLFSYGCLKSNLYWWELFTNNKLDPLI